MTRIVFTIALVVAALSPGLARADDDVEVRVGGAVFATTTVIGCDHCEDRGIPSDSREVAGVAGLGIVVGVGRQLGSSGFVGADAVIGLGDGSWTDYAGDREVAGGPANGGVLGVDAKVGYRLPGGFTAFGTAGWRLNGRTLTYIYNDFEISVTSVEVGAGFCLEPEAGSDGPYAQLRVSASAWATASSPQAPDGFDERVEFGSVMASMELGYHWR